MYVAGGRVSILVAGTVRGGPIFITKQWEAEQKCRFECSFSAIGCVVRTIDPNPSFPSNHPHICCSLFSLLDGNSVLGSMWWVLIFPREQLVSNLKIWLGCIVTARVEPALFESEHSG